MWVEFQGYRRCKYQGVRVLRIQCDFVYVLYEKVFYFAVLGQRDFIF